MPFTKPAITAATAYAGQVFVVMACDSGLFGLFGPDSGWYSNEEMAKRYASLVTPAKYAFAIWGLIGAWEVVGLAYLLLREKAPPRSSGWLWLAANAWQAVWALLFATEHLLLSAFALAGIAASLVGLAASLHEGGAAYWLLTAPVWVHAGWTTAATLVNANLVLVATKAALSAQLAAAFATVGLGLAVSFFARSTGPLPYALALVWALL